MSDRATTLCPIMTPAEHVRIVLREYGRRGVCFDDAWTLAMRSLPKGKNATEKAALEEWKPILRWAKPFFRLSFAQLVEFSDGCDELQKKQHNNHENHKANQKLKKSVATLT